MRMNHRPSNVCFLDFETQSLEPIKSGMRKYCDHPSTKVLTCVVRRDGKNYKFGPYPFDASDLLKVTEGATIVAHNAPFDASVWERVLKLPEREWFDTIPCARAAGYPGGLDRLSRSIGGRGKDKNGERLIDMLCILKPNKPIPVVGAAHDLLLEYNVQDVEELEYIYERVRGFGEPDVIAVDRTINERGIPMDRDRLKAIVAMMAEEAASNEKDFADLTDGVNPRSVPATLRWLASLGFNVDSVAKVAVQNLLSRPEDAFVGDSDMDAALEVVQEALEMRAAAVTVGSSKAASALAVLDDDGRVRDQLVYYGAHTGRWSGRRLQPHNLPGNVGHGLDVKNIPLDILEVRKAAASVEGMKVHPSQVLGSMVKTCVREKLVVADYGQIELRGLGWSASESKLMAALLDPKRSIYVDMGSTLFGKPIDKKKDYDAYQLAKSVVLGCGYGMSGVKFAALMIMRNVPLGPLYEVGLKPEDCARIFRNEYPAVKQLWDKFLQAALLAVEHGSTVEAGRCTFARVGPDLHMVLPSGRPMVYRNARVELKIPAYCAMYNMPEVPKPTIVYDKPNGVTGFLYGSKICENAIQALCRDLMANALVKCEQVGLRTVVHVHDEIVCLGEEPELDLLMEIMCDAPEWARGIPILVEGYAGDCWTKQPKGFLEKARFGGRL